MPQPDQRIGEYLLEEPLGSGAFGEVWRARHHVWADQRVAIKIPKDPQYVRSLQQEGVAIHGLLHPNIVRAIGFDPYATPPYLVTEYVPGTNLRSYIQKRSLTAEDATAILRQVLAGLKAAHDKGIVHRDIKAENILVHRQAETDGFVAEGVVKVTDFGLGRIQNGSGLAASIVHSRSMDAQGKEIAGTLEYMAPEQRAGESVDARADLYACGVVLFEMLTGDKPAGTDVPSDLNPKSPPQLDEVFKRSYARLDKRFKSADEFAAALGGTLVPRLTPVSRQCPACRTTVDPGDQFCTQCGQQLVARIRRCPKCRAYPDLADRFCLFCGETLEGAAKMLA